MSRVSIAAQREDAERPARQRREFDLAQRTAGELGVELEEIYDTGTGRFRPYNADEMRLRGTERTRRRELEKELEAIRSGNAALNRRAQETITLGRRGINEGERLRMQQAESGLASLNLSESLLGERVRRAERETTAMQQADLESKVRIEEMGQTFTAEMQAIERLFQHGQNDLAYLRQARLIGIQAQYAQELEDIRSGNAFFAGLGEALGQILTVSSLFAINPGLGAAVAAGG